MAEISTVYSILKSSLVTEKATKIAPYHQYIFKVNRDANVLAIKKAVEKIYNVKVAKVNTLMVKGKAKKIRWNQPGKTTAWKKAFVTLKKGFEIKFT